MRTPRRMAWRSSATRHRIHRRSRLSVRGRVALSRCVALRFGRPHTALSVVALGPRAGARPARPSHSRRSSSASTTAGSPHDAFCRLRLLLPIDRGLVSPSRPACRPGIGTEVGLALYAAANVITFTAVIWLAARSLNRVDADRRGPDFRRLHVVREAETRWRALVEASVPDRLDRGTEWRGSRLALAPCFHRADQPSSSRSMR